MTPIRVQRSRKKGYKLPENTVCVSRGTKYGNPFEVSKDGNKWIITTSEGKRCEEILAKNAKLKYNTKEEATIDAIKCYSKWIVPYEHSSPISDFYISKHILQEAISDLRGKTLACWCKLDEHCHADFLLKLVNEDQK